MIKILGSTPIQKIPQPEPNHVILVFEPTREGYTLVLRYLALELQQGWIPQRFCIPFDKNNLDVGDVLFHDCRADLNYRADPNTIKSVSPIQLIEEVGQREWPRISKNSIYDFKMALEELILDVTLPDAKTGLSQIQEYILEKEMDLTMVAAHFYVDYHVVRNEYDKLFQGIRPTMTFRDEMGQWPKLLLNGPFPISLQFLHEKIIRFIDYGTIDEEWNTIVPEFTSGNNTSYCTHCPVTKDVIKPPYGITNYSFSLANIPDCISSFDFRFKSTASRLVSNKLIWNGRCRGGLFSPHQHPILDIGQKKPK